MSLDTASGVLPRAELVRVDVVSELALVERPAHKVAAYLLVIEVVREEIEHLRRAHIDVTVAKIRSHLDVGMLAEQAGVQRHRRQLPSAVSFPGVLPRRRIIVVVQDAPHGRVQRDDEVALARALFALPPVGCLDAHRHDRELLRLPSLSVRLDRASQVHVRDRVPGHEHEVPADDVPVVDQPHRFARADAVGGHDRVHDEPGDRAPRALLQVRGDLRRVRAAEDEHLLHAVAREELQGVLDHRDVHERQEDLRALERDGAEPLRERVREDDRLERDLRLLRVFASVRHRAGWRKGGGFRIRRHARAERIDRATGAGLGRGVLSGSRRVPTTGEARGSISRFRARSEEAWKNLTAGSRLLHSIASSNTTFLCRRYAIADRVASATPPPSPPPGADSAAADSKSSSSAIVVGIARRSSSHRRATSACALSTSTRASCPPDPASCAPSVPAYAAANRDIKRASHRPPGNTFSRGSDRANAPSPPSPSDFSTDATAALAARSRTAASSSPPPSHSSGW
eukprot:18543-Pelagococcus_subviridis.AAC.2